MKAQFRLLLNDIDHRLSDYFLVKGGRLMPVPRSKAEYDNLINNGYEPLGEGTSYQALNRAIIDALNEIIDGLGQRALLLFPLAVAAIIDHEAKRSGSALHNALYASTEATNRAAGQEAGEDKETKRRKR